MPHIAYALRLHPAEIYTTLFVRDLEVRGKVDLYPGQIRTGLTYTVYDFEGCSAMVVLFVEIAKNVLSRALLIRKVLVTLSMISKCL